MITEDDEKITTYKPLTDGKCPHCQHIVNFCAPETVFLTRPRKGPILNATELYTQCAGDSVHAYSSRCPSCSKPIVAAEIRIQDKKSTQLPKRPRRLMGQKAKYEECPQ